MKAVLKLVHRTILYSRNATQVIEQNCLCHVCVHRTVCEVIRVQERTSRFGRVHVLGGYSERVSTVAVHC